ncbi:MAG: hypothetical protein CVT92_02485 [Bacteroidetes bacterium HGW-Bacteroidetes-1]|jgi:hypothetical protein|nr:MAG: hypothetical protein CVT92_02485 [Bacteroidetes bacterium HGW-Bacteroidetes-1]
MRLSDIAVKNNVAPVTYDDTFKVSFDLMFLPKRELQKITASNTKMKANPKTHVMEEQMDSEAVRKEICQMCVKGWKNVTYKWLANHINVDLTKVNPDEELPFSQDNLTDLMEMMYGLDGWIFDSVKNAANFKDEQVQAEVKN